MLSPGSPERRPTARKKYIYKIGRQNLSALLMTAAKRQANLVLAVFDIFSVLDRPGFGFLPPRCAKRRMFGPLHRLHQPVRSAGGSTEFNPTARIHLSGVGHCAPACVHHSGLLRGCGHHSHVDLGTGLRLTYAASESAIFKIAYFFDAHYRARIVLF